MYQNTGRNQQNSLHPSLPALGRIYLGIAGIFWKEGTISGVFFLPAVIDTVGEAEDERRRAVMRARRERE